jgi:hypothetical protein
MKRYTIGFVVKIADFGLSRLELPSGRILSNASVGADAFDSHKDVVRSHLFHQIYLNEI